MARRKLEKGDVLDDFELVERLPSGGMASIWRARKPGIDVPIILKVPFLDPGQDVSVIVCYEMEEMISRRLTGPHVPRFFGFGDLREIPYIAMEFVEGDNVAGFLANAPLSHEEVRRIGMEAARALVSLHGQKVAHLDLKPENIILSKRGAVIIDYGLAHHAELPDFLAEESAVPMGSSAYISPEQVLGERTDPASDIFALGCILYQLATGIEPFGRPQTTAGMRQRLYHPPNSLRKVNPKAPRWLQQIVENCVEVDRSRRYSDASQLLHDLHHPEQIMLFDRTEPRRGGLKGLLSLFRQGAKPSGKVAKNGPPVVVTAVDLTQGTDALAEEIRNETMRILATRSDSRLACVTVLKTELIGEQKVSDSGGRSIYIKHLVALKDWAHKLHLGEGRLSFHVLEAVNPADAILDFAQHNSAAHIVMGARGSSAIRRHLGSVSTKVVAEASCSVSVVRVNYEW